ncbi:hypothetical protein L21SP5_03785 [Salinivirga cyanobacteriivorans]|uniref:Uncharacterized protein n=1 Tax=Salinivirga cyanobacteriivorans TaxID=1307839 RepID=A0A0S2I5C6_9BACT|nr:hypothetical protein [Salinivirga cyanobacteriivorans]ALO17380.1 hypothetical protein L21SP5_03785 [Salinivirga cyanobacteriivorans]
MRKFLLIICLVIVSQILIANPKNKSESQNKTTVELEFSQKENKSDAEKYFGYIKDLLGPLVALLGILLTLPILRKKLIENHITTKLNEIQSKNTEIQSYNQKLIDKYIPLTYSNDLMTKADLENALSELQKGFHISQNASSDVATLMFYLKTAVQGAIKHFDNQKSKLFSTRGFYGFIMDNLDLVNYYSKQVVQIPKSTKTKKSTIISKAISKYVSHSKIEQFKYFKLGIIDSPDSAHFTIFSGNVNKTNHALLMRSTFQIYLSPKAIAKLLFINKIYAPLIISKPHEDPLFGTKSFDLYLIGFSINNQISVDPEAPSKVVDLIYSNPLDFHRFIDALKYEKLKSDFKDIWIPDSKFDLSKSISMSKTEIETFKLKYDKEYLFEMHKNNKRKIKKKIKITVPNTRYS